MDLNSMEGQGVVLVLEKFDLASSRCLPNLFPLDSLSLISGYLDKMEIGSMLHLVFQLRIPKPLRFPCCKIGPR